MTGFSLIEKTRLIAGFSFHSALLPVCGNDDIELFFLRLGQIDLASSRCAEGSHGVDEVIDLICIKRRATGLDRIKLLT